MPEKDITVATLAVAVRRLQRKVAAIERERKERPLTTEELAALDEAERAYRSGRTVRLA